MSGFTTWTLFYGKKGSAADLSGTVNIKGDSKYVTVAYNRFWDNGKASMCGMKSETGENWITYHQAKNSFRPFRLSYGSRCITMSVHMYNNYYQHCDVYGHLQHESSSFKYIHGVSNYLMLLSVLCHRALSRVLMPRVMVLSLVRKVV